MSLQILGLKNFQSHLDTRLSLHPYFNAFVGTGNSGKTSLVRALLFALYGQWDASWVREGAEYCQVDLVNSDGVKIIREKGEKRNRYILRVPGQKEQIYENFGRQIPSEIEKVLQVFKVQIDTNDYLNLNISSQMDPMFLLSKPGSFKAKVLGKLSGAHYIDHALREINKDKKRLSTEKGLRETEKLDIQKQLISYKDIEQQKARLEDIGEKIHHTTRKIEYVQQLKQLISKVTNWKERYLIECESETKLQGLQPEKTTKFLEAVNRLKQLKDLATKIGKHDSLFVQNRRLEVDMDIEKRKILSKYFDLLRQHKKCPTCYSIIDDQKIETIKENING